MGRWAILNVILGLIVILLVVQLVRTWTRSIPPVEVSTRAPAAGAGESSRGGKRSKRGGAERDVPPAVMVATIVNKDLFDPSRQKATATQTAAVEAPKETGPPPNLSLVGVRIFGRDREAFLIDTGKGNAQQRLREGDEIGGFTLKAIEPRRVVLGNAGGEVITLSLTIETKSGGAGGAPGAPPRPGRGPAVPMAPGGTSPAAGVAAGTSPAAGVVPAPSSMPPPGMVGRPGAPGAINAPGAPGAPGAAAAAAAAARRAGGAPQVPQLPAGVREKLEQLKGKQ